MYFYSVCSYKKMKPSLQTYDKTYRVVCTRGDKFNSKIYLMSYTFSLFYCFRVMTHKNNKFEKGDYVSRFASQYNKANQTILIFVRFSWK